MIKLNDSLPTYSKPTYPHDITLFHNLLEKNLIAETKFHDQDVDQLFGKKIILDTFKD